jgi:hypothetical protein
MIKNRPPILVTGHQHSGTTLLGSHVASAKMCSLIWEPLNPGTSYYRFPLRIDEWFINPEALNVPQRKAFVDALKRSTSFISVPLKINDIAHPVELLKCIKYAIQNSYGYFAKMRPIVKDPISLFAIDWYLSQGFDVIVIIKKPDSFVAAELSRGNIPPWHSLISKLSSTDWPSDISSYLDQSLHNLVPLDLQHALYWYCSFFSTNLHKLDQSPSSRRCLVNCEQYVANIDHYIIPIFQSYDLEPTNATLALIKGHSLNPIQLVDGFLRNYEFSYVRSAAVRTKRTKGLPFSEMYLNFSCKYLSPLLSDLGWL